MMGRQAGAAGAAIDQEEREAPIDFLCPITRDVMEDPVVAPDGHTYERSAIERWLLDRATSPMTRQRFDQPVALVPDMTLRRLIRHWQESDGAGPAELAAAEREARLQSRIAELERQLGRERADRPASPRAPAVVEPADEQDPFALCQRGNVGGLQALVRANPGVARQRTDMGESLLYMACREGQLGVVRYLLTETRAVEDISEPFIGGFLPLHAACQGGHTAVAQLLLDRAVVDAEDDDGRTALYHACRLDMFKLLNCYLM